MPQAICELTPDGGINRNLIVNRDKPPFDNPELRRAMARASIARRSSTSSATVRARWRVLQPAPGGLWGMPPDLLKELPGYAPDVQKSMQARQIMEKLGYGPDKRLKSKVSTRDLSSFGIRRSS